MDRLELAIAEPGYYLVCSASTTVYVLDTAGPTPRMMRSTAPGARTGRGWWDNQWAPLVSVEAEIPDGYGTIAAGSRVRWVADPGGRSDANEWWWISRQVTSIEKVSVQELEDFLAGRGVPAGEASTETEDLDDETDEILRDPEILASVLEGLADLEAGRTNTAEEVRGAMGERTQRNRSQHAHLDKPARQSIESGLTEQVNAALEKSGPVDGDTAWAVEMSHKLLRELADDWSSATRSQPAIQQVVAELNAELGATLVAALSGTRNSKQPYSWEAGDAQPDDAAETRLRLARELWRLLAVKEGGDVARAVFIGSNPALNDDTIITALREDRFDEARGAVYAFITDAWTL